MDVHEQRCRLIQAFKDKLPVEEVDRLLKSNCSPPLDNPCAFVDEDGYTLLHYASLVNPTASIISLLLQLNRLAARVTAKDGNTPLMMALMSESHSSSLLIVIQTLVQVFPGALRLPNSKGETPFMVACTFQSCAIVEYLYLEFPVACLIRNKDGVSPLQLVQGVQRADNAATLEARTSALLQLLEKANEVATRALIDAAQHASKTLQDAATFKIVATVLSTAFRKLHGIAVMESLVKNPSSIELEDLLQDEQVQQYLISSTGFQELVNALMYTEGRTFTAEDVNQQTPAACFSRLADKCHPTDVLFMHSQHRQFGLEAATTAHAAPRPDGIVNILALAASKTSQLTLIPEMGGIPTTPALSTNVVAQFSPDQAQSPHYDTLDDFSPEMSQNRAHLVQMLFDCLPAKSVKEVVVANPQVLMMKDDAGFLPIHFACFFCPSDSIISLFLEQNRESARVVTNDGDTALSLALANKTKEPPSLQAIQTLVHAFPQALRTVNIRGETPLLLACIHSAPFLIVQYLHLEYPSACLIADSDSRLPVQVAKLPRGGNNKPFQSTGAIAYLEMATAAASAAMLDAATFVSKTLQSEVTALIVGTMVVINRRRLHGISLVGSQFAQPSTSQVSSLILDKKLQKYFVETPDIQEVINGLLYKDYPSADDSNAGIMQRLSPVVHISESIDDSCLDWHFVNFSDEAAARRPVSETAFLAVTTTAPVNGALKRRSPGEQSTIQNGATCTDASTPSPAEKSNRPSNSKKTRVDSE